MRPPYNAFASELMLEFIIRKERLVHSCYRNAASLTSGMMLPWGRAGAAKQPVIFTWEAPCRPCRTAVRKAGRLQPCRCWFRLFPPICGSGRRSIPDISDGLTFTYGGRSDGIQTEPSLPSSRLCEARTCRSEVLREAPEDASRG